MNRVPILIFVASSAMGACGGSQAPAAQTPADEPASAGEAPSEDAPAEESEEHAAEAEAAEPKGLPAECASAGDVCAPPGKWVDRLCQGSYPNVALVMFAKGTPWTRGYLTRKTEAWNASGGASVAGMLEFDEEVLVLRQRTASKGGMQVSGAGGGFDALRWDGSCVTLAAEELTMRPPPQPGSAKVEWKYLEESIRDALREDEGVDEAYRKRRSECKGVTMGAVSQACETWDRKLGERIVELVRRGGALPTPEKRP